MKLCYQKYRLNLLSRSHFSHKGLSYDTALQSNYNQPEKYVNFYRPQNFVLELRNACLNRRTSISTEILSTILTAELYCHSHGRLYPTGTTFYDNECQGRCTCTEDNGRVGVRCVSLCPPIFYRCQPGQVLETYFNKVDERCYCRRQRCVSKLYRSPRGRH